MSDQTNDSEAPQEARDLLQKHDPCREGYDWLNGHTAEVAWNTCERADWMLWAMEKFQVPSETFVLCARRIALSVSHLWDMPPVVRAFLEAGENPEAARAAARAAAWAAEGAAEGAAWAARAAARAAAWAAAWAAEAAAEAAWAVEAAWAAAALATIIREVLPWSEMRKYVYEGDK